MLIVVQSVTPEVSISPLLSHYKEESTVTLFCFVMSPLIDTATFTIMQWKKDDSNVINSTSVYNSPRIRSNHTLIYTIDSIKLSDAGQFTCSSFTNTTIVNPFVKESETNVGVITIDVMSK